VSKTKSKLKLHAVLSRRKKVLDVLYQRPVKVAQELRYSVIEVKYYVFGLKCLVPAQL
jgi:hypothetical protein